MEGCRVFSDELIMNCAKLVYELGKLASMA